MDFVVRLANFRQFCLGKVLGQLILLGQHYALLQVWKGDALISHIKVCLQALGRTTACVKKIV